VSSKKNRRGNREPKKPKKPKLAQPAVATTMAELRKQRLAGRAPAAR
jgi:hypothetical protein